LVGSLFGYLGCWCEIAVFGLRNSHDKALQSFETGGTTHQTAGTVSEDLNLYVFIDLNW